MSRFRSKQSERHFVSSKVDIKVRVWAANQRASKALLRGVVFTIDWYPMTTRPIKALEMHETVL